jgi:hypothetical protein
MQLTFKFIYTLFEKKLEIHREYLAKNKKKNISNFFNYKQDS